MSIYPTSALPGMQQVASGFRPRIAFIGGIYHETAAALLAQTMDVVPLHTPSPEEIRIALRDCHSVALAQRHGVCVCVVPLPPAARHWRAAHPRQRLVSPRSAHDAAV